MKKGEVHKTGYNKGPSNSMYGKRRSSETIEKLQMSARARGLWKGDNVGYGVLHKWVKKRIPKPELCPSCQNRPSLDLANITGIYNRDLENWTWLCRRCHMLSDDRMNNLLKSRPRIDMSDRHCSRCGTNKTRIVKERPQWRYSNNQLVCNNCYHYIRRHQLDH